MRRETFAQDSFLREHLESPIYAHDIAGTLLYSPTQFRPSPRGCGIAATPPEKPSDFSAILFALPSGPSRRFSASLA
jgi:hypothetical protein